MVGASIGSRRSRRMPRPRAGPMVPVSWHPPSCSCPMRSHVHGGQDVDPSVVDHRGRRRPGLGVQAAL